MTTTTLTTEKVYTGDGVTDTFVFDFPVSSDAEVKNLVGIGASAAWAAATVTLNSDQDTNPGGTVVFDTTPPDEGAANILLYRETAPNQLIDLAYRGPLPTRTLEAGYDKLTRLVQELATKLGRAVVTPAAASGYPAAPILPAPEVGMAIGWAAGGELTNLAVGGGGTGGLVPFTETAVYTVGATGDYPTLNAALADMAYLRKAVLGIGVEIELQIQAGTTIAEQVLVDGLDLSFVRITSAGGPVTVSQAALTTAVVRYFGGAGASYPFLAGLNGARLPRIRARFESDGLGDPTGRVGLLLDRASHAQVISGNVLNRAGINGFLVCALVSGHSKMEAHYAEFNGSTATGVGVQAVQGGRADLSSCRIVSQGAGLLAWQGGRIDMFAGVLTAAAAPAVSALTGGEITVRDLATFSGAGTAPVVNALCGRVDLEDVTVTNAGTGHGVQAARGSVVRMEGVTVSGTTAPADDIFIETGSTVVANNATIPQGANVALNTVTAAGVVYG